MPSHVLNPAHEAVLGQLAPPHEANGAQVATPAQVSPNGLQVAVARQVAPPAQVALPGKVGGGQGIRTHVGMPWQLAIGPIVTKQKGSPGQVRTANIVGQSAGLQVTRPGIVGGMHAGFPAGQVGQPC